MDVVEYNPDKKALPIVGIILMVLGLLGYIIYFILNRVVNIIPYNGMDLAILIAVIVVFGTGLVCNEIAKKRKYGSRSMLRVADVLSWGLIIVLVIGIILRFFIH